MVKRQHQKNRILINLLVMASSTFLIILVLEVFFRIYLGRNLSYDYDQDGLWTLKPNQSGFTCANEKQANINKYGFRGQYDPQKKSVLFLGDSFTFGYCLRDNETLTYHLNRIFRERFGCSLQMVNMGVPGYGIFNMIKSYYKKANGIDADYIVLNFIEGDVLRQPGDEDPYHVRKMFVRKMIRRSSLIAYLKPKLEIFREAITGRRKKREDSFHHYVTLDMNRIAEFNRTLVEQNKRLILHVWRYSENQRSFYSSIRDFADSEGISMFEDHFPYVFLEYGGKVEDLFCKEDGHPSGIQTERIAQKISTELFDFIGKCCDDPVHCSEEISDGKL